MCTLKRPSRAMEIDAAGKVGHFPPLFSPLCLRGTQTHSGARWDVIVHVPIFVLKNVHTRARIARTQTSRADGISAPQTSVLIGALSRPRARSVLMCAATLNRGCMPRTKLQHLISSGRAHEHTTAAWHAIRGKQMRVSAHRTPPFSNLCYAIVCVI